ncbi:MAG: hypothetical protein AB7E04_02655 [Desulfobacteraceae bacterium]
MKNTNKINLDEDGIILFLGTMNAMPMHYAMELRKLNQEVVYFVDEKKENTLHRPECHFKNSISYPYPDWIIELIIPSQLLISLFPQFFKFILLKSLPNKYKNKRIKAIFYSGFYASLINLFTNNINIFLSYGSDLEYFCNIDLIDELSENFKNKSFVRYLPKKLVHIIIKKVVNNQFLGAKESNYVLFFPKGYSVKGDKVIKRLIENNVKYIERYNDMYIDDFKCYIKKSKFEDKELFILCATRFIYSNLTLNDQENKGNDIIIKGIAKYIQNTNRKIVIHFFEKGQDVNEAKKLCKELGIENNIIWHRPMPMHKLLKLYEQSHICFDQLGNNWLGAIGLFAILLGIPLISNVSKYKVSLPVLNATNEEEVYARLIQLENRELYERISLESKKYAVENLTPLKVLKQLIIND